MQIRLEAQVLILLQYITGASSIICHQCSGWSGSGYSRATTEENTCQNYNNQCQTDFFCVRKEDPIIPSAGYKTFKLDCWMQPNVQATPSQSYPIVSGFCYNVTDASVPPKQWKYCYCARGDYCNSSYSKIGTISTLLILLMLLLQTEY